MERVLGNALFKKWRVQGNGALMLIFIAMRGGEISAVYRAVNRDFSFRTAADGTDFFALGRTKASFFSFFTNRTGQESSPE